MKKMLLVVALFLTGLMIYDTLNAQAYIENKNNVCITIGCSDNGYKSIYVKPMEMVTFDACKAFKLYSCSSADCQACKSEMGTLFSTNNVTQLESDKVY